MDKTKKSEKICPYLDQPCIGEKCMAWQLVSMVWDPMEPFNSNISGFPDHGIPEIIERKRREQEKYDAELAAWEAGPRKVTRYYKCTIIPTINWIKGETKTLEPEPPSPEAKKAAILSAIALAKAEGKGAENGN